MAGDVALPSVAVQFLNALGLSDLSALTRDEALAGVPAELAATFYGMCWMGSLEDQLLAMRYLLTNTTNQISLNNKGEKIWATREKIMKAQWPADEAKQQEVLALLEADLATGTPADPPIPPLTQLVVNPDEVDNPDDSNDTPLEQLQNKLDAMQKTAQAVLDKLNGYANAGEAMVDWPTDASTEAGLSTWLAAQGVSSSDLTTDAYWLNGTDNTVVTLETLSSQKWSAPAASDQYLMQLQTGSTTRYYLYRPSWRPRSTACAGWAAWKTSCWRCATC